MQTHGVGGKSRENKYIYMNKEVRSAEDE